MWHLMHSRVGTSVWFRACEHALHFLVWSLACLHILAEKCMAWGKRPLHTEQSLSSCRCLMHTLQRPWLELGLAACFHSESVKPSRVFLFPHAGLRHWRCSRQFLHQTSEISLLRHIGGSNIGSACQSPHHLHCFFKPLCEHSLSQFLHRRLVSLRFHCGSENSALKALVLQPWHMCEGMCCCSTAAQSTCSPRKTCNKRLGPSKSPWLNRARSKGLKIKRSSAFLTLVNAT